MLLFVVSHFTRFYKIYFSDTPKILFPPPHYIFSTHLVLLVTILDVLQKPYAVSKLMVLLVLLVLPKLLQVHALFVPLIRMPLMVLLTVQQQLNLKVIMQSLTLLSFKV